MEFIVKVEKLAEEWKSENKENRAVIIMTIENVKDLKGKEHQETNDLTIGRGGLIVDMLYHRISDKTKDESNVLPPLLRRAIARVQLDIMTADLLKKAKKIDKMFKELGFDEDDNEETATDTEKGGSDE